MSKLDPQVQVKAMDFALNWTSRNVANNSSIETWAKKFDEAYKAIIVTLAEAEEMKPLSKVETSPSIFTEASFVSHALTIPIEKSRA